MANQYRTPGVYINEGPQTPEQQAAVDAVFGNHDASQSTLDVIRLPVGEEEPEGEDYVQIVEHADGGFAFSGVVSIHAADVEPGSRTSISGATGDEGPFPTADAADAAAIEWAAEQGAETLYVLTCRQSPEVPVPPTVGHIGTRGG